MSRSPVLRPLGPPGARTAIIVVAALFAFALALGLQGVMNVWYMTAAAAALALALTAALWPATFRLLRTTSSQVVLGALVGLVMVLATHGGYAVVSALFPSIEAPVRQLYAAIRAAPPPVVAVPLLGLVVLAEEVVFRGVLFTSLATRTEDGSSGIARTIGIVFLCSFIYALPQLAAPTLLLMGVAFACGLLWTAQRAQSRGLMAPLLTHLIWDIGIFWLVPLV